MKIPFFESILSTKDKKTHFMSPTKLSILCFYISLGALLIKLVPDSVNSFEDKKKISKYRPGHPNRDFHSTY